jgi:hypothetical protein
LAFSLLPKVSSATGLHSEQMHGAVGFVNRERLLPVGPAAPRALRDDEALDLLLSEPGPDHAFERHERETITHGES